MLYIAVIFSLFLYLPVLIMRVDFEKIGLLKPTTKRTKKEAEVVTRWQFQEKHGIVNWMMSSLERSERKKLLKGKIMPFGSSIILIARKR